MFWFGKVTTSSAEDSESDMLKMPVQPTDADTRATWFQILKRKFVLRF